MFRTRGRCDTVSGHFLGMTDVMGPDTSLEDQQWCSIAEWCGAASQVDPMGRASKAQAAENRQEILETACRLFRTHGVENVSVADIMRAADLTQGPSRNSLVLGKR